MSVLIKGMKKPKNCCFIIDGETEFCPFVNTDDDCVLLLGGECYGTWEEQYADCPLVELPEKRGRLIDGDELFKQMNIAVAMMSGMMKAIDAEDDKEMQMELKAYRDIMNGIKNCETVIEAEGEG